ncbi:MAG: hypothetical protein ACLPYS_16210 [Vulcanimicrobiaceae bacterium]
MHERSSSSSLARADAPGKNPRKLEPNGVLAVSERNIRSQEERSGVSLYARLPISPKDVSEVAGTLARAIGAGITANGGSLSAEIVSAGEFARLEVVPGIAESAPPEITRLLGSAPGGHLRIEAVVHPAEPEAARRAEILLTSCAADLALRCTGLVRDDLGFVYDPVELDAIGKRSGSRDESFAYLAALALRDMHPAEPSDYGDPPLSSVERLAAPTLPFPDLAATHALVFAASGPRLPLVDLTRIVMAASGDARANPGRRPVLAFAPALEDTERRALHAIGVESVDTVEALAPADGSEFVSDDSHRLRERPQRDELMLFSPLPVDVQRARDVLEGLMIDLRESPAAEDASMPRSMRCIAEDPSVVPGFPIAIGTFDFPHASVDVYHLDLGTAHPVLRASVGDRVDIAAVLGAAPRSVTIVELAQTDDGGDRDFLRADAFSVAIAQAYLAATRALAADAMGTLFGPDELTRLVSARQGRSQSWSARVARMRLNARTS